MNVIKEKTTRKIKTLMVLLTKDGKNNKMM